MLRVAIVDQAALQKLLTQYGVKLTMVPDAAPIPFSHWGAPEAGIRNKEVFARMDTPLHSVLHEFCHLICMDPDRRSRFHSNAGGTVLEECAVCYLQVLLADQIPGFGRETALKDMDDWGYSFREGSAAAWFDGDGLDAAQWLRQHGLISSDASPTFAMREK